MKTIAIYEQNYKGIPFVFATEASMPFNAKHIISLIARNEEEAIVRYNFLFRGHK